MKVLQLIQDYTGILITFFVVGCGVSLVRTLRRDLSEQAKKWLKLCEWCLIPPGFAALFILLQQRSVSYFALYPKETIAAYASVAVVSILLLLQKKQDRVFLGWIRGMFGVPGLIFSVLLLGQYFQSPQRFEEMRTTYTKLAAAKGEKAPDFGFVLLSSREKRQLSDYRGRVVLLNVWATWCVPCLKEMPDLDTLQRKFTKDGLVIINLSDESIEVIERYLAKNPMVTSHGRVERRDVPEFYQFGGARPTTFLINSHGEVVEAIVGARDLNYFERTVMPILFP